MPPNDFIILKDLSFFGYHGVFPEEEKLGQRFLIDLTCGLDLREAGDTDNLSASVSYADIVAVTQSAFEARRFQLIEALASAVAQALFSAFAPIQTIRIRVAKPSAPIPMNAGLAAVELYRERSR